MLATKQRVAVAVAAPAGIDGTRKAATATPMVPSCVSRRPPVELAGAGDHRQPEHEQEVRRRPSR
jgi:hypothetical protein